VAQTKKKRRRKHRGTQGGGISTRPKGRPRNRAEARARAQARRSGAKGAKGGMPTRGLVPPTWGSAIKKGLFAGLIFFVLLALIFKEPVPQAAALAAFMLVFYIPMGYMTDRFFYNRQLRKQARERQQAQSGNGA
jgi:hypothetical protein